uniref:Gamma interferon inducible lysosomal thiol reductase n=1 Tax=Panagrolaimus sp. JU765 TaxID=591449 RepID=A0AC34QGA4_9BILA
MMMKWYFGRFLLRQYIYPLICFLLLLLLIKWNSQPQKIVIEHEKWHDEAEKQIQKVKVDDLPKPANKVIDTQSGNVVHVSIYMEAQCPDTSRFISKQLLPTFQHLKSTGRVEIELVAFGKARCERTGDDFKCYCQHGSDECELNQLMNCAIHDLGFAESYVPLIGCIQGSNSLGQALEKCVNKGQFQPYATRLKECAEGPRGRHLLALAGQKTAALKPALNFVPWECAEGPRGRHLLALAGQKTTALKPALNFVPWVMLEGSRNVDAFYALEENVCKTLDPRPSECQPVLAQA